MSVERPETVGHQDGGRYLLSVLGGLTLIERPTGADVLPRGRKAKALVAYLALNGGFAVTRERLATLLWGDRQNEQARASLRQLLLELRDLSLGSDALLVVERGEIGLRRDLLTLDADLIERCAKIGDMIGLQAALDRLRHYRRGRALVGDRRRATGLKALKQERRRVSLCGS